MAPLQPRKQPPLHADRRRKAFLTSADYREIFARMNDPNAPRGTSIDLATKFRIKPAHVIAIARGNCGRRHLGDHVEMLPGGLRSYRADRRDLALKKRGVREQHVTFSYLGPVSTDTQATSKKGKAKASAA